MRKERGMQREEGRAHVVRVGVHIAPLVEDEQDQPTKDTHQEENL